MSETASGCTLTEEIADFLARGPFAEEIARFRVSNAARKRVAALMDRNENGTLTAEESAELDEITVPDKLSPASALVTAITLLVSHPRKMAGITLRHFIRISTGQYVNDPAV